ncbi:hypothetical protein [Devosia sp.]|uniref:hypothetical protein n=1 Tax=Devosia sp. TaxID=1871048 RepID=UPI00262E8DA0|nr:hypothetical protein [Devosia sp.]
MAEVLKRRVLTIAAALLLGAAGFVGYLEAVPYLNTGPAAADQFRALRSGAAADGLSIGSHVVAMDACLLALTSGYGRAQPTRDRLAVADTCTTRAAADTAVSPSFAYGWYVEAAASSLRKDWAAMNRTAVMAQRTAPTEQWLAELRVALAEQNFVELDPAALAAHESDLALLVRSRRGVASIATRYVEDQAFRARITDIVETLDPAAQRAFVDAVQAAAGME